MRSSPTADRSSDSAGGPGDGELALHLWDLAPELTRRLLAESRPRAGRLQPVADAAAALALAEAGEPAGLLLCAPDAEALPRETIDALRASPALRLVLLLPDCDERLWLRLRRRGCHDVLAPPFRDLDLDLAFADLDRDAPLSRRLPELEARVRTEVEFAIPGELRYVAPAAGFIARLAREHGFHPRVWAENLPLALDEALANAVEHGCAGVEDAEIGIQVWVQEEVLKVRIEDPGGGFDPAGRSESALGDGLERPGGRGLLLMESLMDRVRFEAGGRAVVLYARRKAPPAG